MPEPRIHIVILNWKNPKVTLECLDSVVQVDYSNFKIVLVDNESEGKLKKAIEGRYRKELIHLIENDENLGFVGGNNIGIKYAMSEGAEYVLLLNYDTVVDKNVIAELLNVAKSKADAGIIGPKIYFFNKPDRFWFAGNKISYTYGKIIQIGHRGYGEVDRGQYDSVEELDFVSGCALFVRRDVFENIGLLDADYFFSWEDADFCVRTRKVGYKLYYAPKSKLWHKEAIAFNGLDSPMYIYYQFRNRLLFVKKNFPLWCWLVFTPAFALIVARRSVKLLMRGRFKALAAIWAGIFDFLMKRYGAKQCGIE